MTVGVDSRENRKCGVSSRAREEKWRTIIAVAIKGTIIMAARIISLNSLIIGVTFEEIVLLGLETSIETLSIMIILNWVG